MPMFVKIGRRVKEKLPMIQPGLRDNSILPSSGAASNSGISIDYSALSIGGVDSGVPYNHADDVVEINEANDITVYHGSHNKFDVFDLGKSRVGEIGKAIYFSENPAISSSYGPNIIELTISPKKPLDFFKMSEAEAIMFGRATGVPASFLKESAELYSNYGSAKWAMCWWELSVVGLEVSHGDAVTREALAKFLQKNGYDAVCFPFHSDNSRTWAVFDPSIITIKKDDESKTNKADDEEEGEKYRAGDLTSNWWVADHRIKLHNKLWERATALLWPWINKVQLSRLKQKDDGTWEEVHKVVDAEDILILLPLATHEVVDLYPNNKETPSSSTKIPTEEATQSYVGTKEDGFAFRHNLDYGTASKLDAVIIKGNVKYIKDNPIAEAFYNDIKNYLTKKGYNVCFESAESDTLPKAQLRIGHSKGLNKLNLCKDERAKLLAIGALPEKSKNKNIVFVNHPEDEQSLRDARKGLRFDIPINEHYIFTNAMKRVIDLFTDELLKEAGTFLNLPQYSDPNMYQQVLNPRNEATEPLEAYDIAETYFADDDLSNPFNYPLEKRRWNQNIGDHYVWNVMMNEFPYLMKKETTNKDIQEWIDALQWRLGIEPKYFNKIYDIIKEQRFYFQKPESTDKNNNEYGKLILFLRQHAYQDPDWISRNSNIQDKKAFPDYPMYSGGPLYQYVNEESDANTTQHFDSWNTYYVNDNEHKLPSLNDLKKIIPQLMSASQKIYDDWIQDEDDELNGGGICHLIADAMCDVMSNAGMDCATLSYQIGEVHVAAVVKLEEGIFSVDIHPSFYERGSAYTWTKLPDVKFESNMLDIEKLSSDPNDFEQYINDANDTVEAFEYVRLYKHAFIKNAVSYDSNPMIQGLLKIPQVKSLLDQQLGSFVEKVIITTPGADVQQTQQRLQQDPNMKDIKIEAPTGSPYGHVFTYKDPVTHQQKPLDKIIRIDQPPKDLYSALVVILHEALHLRHPEHSETDIQSEAERLAGTVKQFLNKAANSKKIMFVKNNLRNLPVIECEIADTYQKQVIGLQNHKILNPKAGMLFSYKNAQPLSFWMGTVAFPIDIIFANATNKILKIYRNCMPNSNEIYSCENASKVIEVVGSFCAFHDLDVNDQIFEADDDAFKQEDFTQYILEVIKDIKIKEQKDLGMEEWNIKIIMDADPDKKKFMKVDWTYQDYASKKADLVINPDPLLISVALKNMSLNTLVRHALLHILAGAKDELSEDKEQELITNKLKEMEK